MCGPGFGFGLAFAGFGFEERRLATAFGFEDLRLFFAFGGQNGCGPQPFCLKNLCTLPDVAKVGYS